MIIDTNAVTALLDGDKNLGIVLDKVQQYYLPLTVVGEFLFGIVASDKRKRYDSLFRRLEAESEPLLPDRETADWYATIRNDLKQRGKPIPEADLWIAALARQHQLQVISQDEHFDVVEGVKRLGW